jgi:hypothetical protein
MCHHHIIIFFKVLTIYPKNKKEVINSEKRERKRTPKNQKSLKKSVDTLK